MEFQIDSYVLSFRTKILSRCNCEWLELSYNVLDFVFLYCFILSIWINVNKIILLNYIIKMKETTNGI